MSNYTLTQGQQEAVTKIPIFLESDNPIFLLSGSAGTGKSFTARKIPELMTQGKMMATATTNKAVQVLKENLPEDQEVMTIHRFLGLKPKRNGDKQTLFRRRDYDPSQYYEFNVVIVDEVSMADSILMKYIQEDAETWNRKYILLGDKYQLPPVGEIYSPCFALDLPDSCQTELTEIMRYAGPIITTATTIRDAIIQKVEPKIVGGTVEGEGVYLMKRDKFDAAIAKAFADPRAENADFARIVAWRNETVIKYNQQVRGGKGEPLDVPFCAGDKLVANEAWMQMDEVMLNTGAEFVVIATEKMSHPYYPELTGWQVWLDGFEEAPVYVLDRLNCAATYKKRLNTLIEQAKMPGGSWVPYYGLLEFFADLRPLYSITSHRSQGSTFRNVFVDLRDMYDNRIKSEADRCLYVAVTRASKNVFILV